MNEAPATTNRTIKSHLEGDAFKAAIAKALPRHLTADRFIRVALTAMMRTPKLAQCDQASFFNCLLTLSQFGLEPDGRRAHLIPFENRKRGVTECQLIIDYRGLVELAMRTGVISTIHAELVCENDDFEWNIGQIIRHRIDFKKPRGKPYAVYALATTKDGGTFSEVMTVEEVEKIRARSRAGQNGPWVTDWDAMALKTVFRRLSKWLPLSPEYRDAAESDADAGQEAIQVDGSVFVMPEALPDAPEQERKNVRDEIHGEHGDGVQTPPPPEPTEQEAQSIKDQLAAIVVAAGYTFDDFMRWAKESGNLTDAQCDVITSFAELPQARAQFFVKNKTGMLRGLATIKAA